MIENTCTIAVNFAKSALKAAGARPADDWTRDAAAQFLADLKAARERGSEFVFDSDKPDVLARLLQLSGVELHLNPQAVFFIARETGFVRREALPA
jgi:hypothetical protein